MDQKYIDINDEVNKLLKNGLILAEGMTEIGREDLATWILKTTSETAYLRLKSSGLQDELRKFWLDKKALAHNVS